MSLWYYLHYLFNNNSNKSLIKAPKDEEEKKKMVSFLSSNKLYRHRLVASGLSLSLGWNMIGIIVVSCCPSSGARPQPEFPMIIIIFVLFSSACRFITQTRPKGRAAENKASQSLMGKWVI